MYAHVCMHVSVYVCVYLTVCVYVCVHVSLCSCVCARVPAWCVSVLCAECIKFIEGTMGTIRVQVSNHFSSAISMNINVVTVRIEKAST